jgi:hypothetical protein
MIAEDEMAAKIELTKRRPQPKLLTVDEPRRRAVNIASCRGRLFLRSIQPLAARQQREHQRFAATVFPARNRSFSQDYLNRIARRLNQRPRKTLGFETTVETGELILLQCHTLLGQFLFCFFVLSQVHQPHATQYIGRFGELNIVVTDDLYSVAPGVPKIKERPLK